MLSANDFSKKQIVFVFCNEGEKLNILNDNLVIKTKEGKVKYQISCYRLFVVYVVGTTSISTVFIQKAKKFGFAIALYNYGLRPYQLFGLKNEGNTLLRQKQYQYQSLDLARYLVKNKIANQRALLMKKRNKDKDYKIAITKIDLYIKQLPSCTQLSDIMGVEGAVSRIYFKTHFDNVNWDVRCPRVKHDMVNSLLDLGYTLLFSFLEVLLNIYGFDVYYGVMHRLFYMRKSLVCDIIEPFRVLIDEQIKKSINLDQFKEIDFEVKNNQYYLKWEKSPEYVAILMEPILSNKEIIFHYIQDYYRAFMKEKELSAYPWFYYT